MQTLEAFLLALSMMESGGNYQTVNTLNYLGAYQFGEGLTENFKIDTSDTGKRGELPSDWDVEKPRPIGGCVARTI